MINQIYKNPLEETNNLIALIILFGYLAYSAITCYLYSSFFSYNKYYMCKCMMTNDKSLNV